VKEKSSLVLEFEEMFRLTSFHMYGVIGSAIVTGIISITTDFKAKH